MVEKLLIYREDQVHVEKDFENNVTDSRGKKEVIEKKKNLSSGSLM